jgi:uncharacterized Zn finger protein (UPF0148 family)
MNCTHPVIYEKNGVLVCQNCGSKLVPVVVVNNPPPEQEQPTEARKTPVKRTTRKTK